MSDNKLPDALDRLRRRPAPSSTPTPVAKDAPLLNDEARKLLEDKSMAAALATKRAAEVGAKKSLEAGKAALGKFNSWRRTQARVVKYVLDSTADAAHSNLEAPVEKLAPLEGFTPSEVAEALSEIAVPKQDEDLVVEQDKSDFIEMGAADGVMTRYGDAYAPDKLLPVGLSSEDLDLGMHLHILGETSSGMTHGGPVTQLTKEEQGQFVENFKANMVGDESEATYEKLSEALPKAHVKWSPNGTHPVETTAELKKEAVAPVTAAKSTKATNLKLYLIAGAVLAVLALGLIALKLTHRESSVAPVEPTSAPTSQPVAPAAVVVPVQAPPDPEPDPVAVEPAPQVIEVAPVAPAPVVVPEAQAVVPAAAPAKPVAVERPVAPPAPKPVPVTKPPAAAKPQAPKPAPAPVVSPESKKQIDSIHDFERQLQNLGG